MPIARFQMPDGRIARFEVPEGTSPEQAQSMMEQYFAKPAETISENKPPSEGIPARRRVDFASMTPEEKIQARNEGIQSQKNIISGVASAVPNIGQNLLRFFGGERLQQAAINTLSGAPDLPYEPGAAQKSQESLVRELTGGEPTSNEARVAELATQIGLTAGAPRLAALGVARFAPNVARAIETGGLAKTALQGRAADYGTRVLGGGIAGAAGTIPIAQSSGDVMAGAGIGAMLPGIGVPVFGAYQAVKNALSPSTRAANILAEAAGPNIQQIRAAAAAAPEELTAAQAIAGTESPQLQAIAKQMAERDAARAIFPKIEAQRAKHEDVLNRLAGGATEAEAVGRTKDMSRSLRKETIPILEQSLTDANAVTKQLTELENLAPQLSRQAAEEVQNVRRLMNSGDVAQASARLGLIRRNLPVGFTQYTYPAELAGKANQWAGQAAERSLKLGEEARQAAGTAQAMRDAGIEPLTADTLTNKIKSVLTVEQTGNDTLKAGVNKVISDINAAASATGAVDARALYAIRKNSVGEFIKKLFPGAMDSAQKAEAARIMAEINPLIDNAIEKSGGKGFSDYLKSYSEGQRSIERTEMGAYLRDLYKKDPKAFAEVVNGNNVKAVQDIFGPTTFDIKKEMGDSLMKKLRPIADDVMQTERMSELAKRGASYAGEIIQKNQPAFRVPGLLPKSQAANIILETMQSRLPAKTLDALEKALVSGKSLNEVLSAVPQQERAFLGRLLEQYKSFPGTAPAVINSLTGENRNNLAKQ